MAILLASAGGGARNGDIITGPSGEQTQLFFQNDKPTPEVANAIWHKPTDNGIPGTAGDWIWTGSDWASANVFSLSIPVVNGNSSNQTIRSESVGTNLGIRVSGLASQIAVLDAAPTSSNYWTAAVSVSGTSITTLSTQNATSYPHNYSTPNTIIPARTAIPVGGTLTATALGQTSRTWSGMTTLGTDVYACVNGENIYKQTNGTGNFIALGQTSRSWYGMTTLGTDVYACVYGGDIYKQTNGTGDFIALGQASRTWVGMTTLGTDVYACVYGGDIYVLNPDGVTSIGHSLKVVLVRNGSASLPYVSITANCQVIHP